MGRILVVVAVCGCGRLGFDPGTSSGTDGPVTPDTPDHAVQFTVRFGDGTTAPDLPVDGARVVLDDGAIHLTDSAGVITIPVTGPRTFHVVHPSRSIAAPNSFRVTSYYDVTPGNVIEVGARPVPAAGTASITVSRSVDPGADEYFLYGPADCGVGLESDPNPSFAWTYQPQCDGKSAELFLISLAGGVAQNTATTGKVTLAGGAAFPFGGFSPVLISTATLRNLPEELTTIVLRQVSIQDDHRYDVGNSGGARGGDGSFGISGPKPLHITHVHAVLRGVPATSSVRAIGALDNSRELDVASAPPLMPPPFPMPATRTVSWGMPGPEADLVRASADIAGAERVLWTIYTPPARRAVTFPDLPNDLATLIPSADAAWNAVDAAAITLTDPQANILEQVDVGFRDLLEARSYPEKLVLLQYATEPP